MLMKKHICFAAETIRFVRWTAAALFFFAPAAAPLAADKPAIEEYQLKAAFVGKLPLFVSWPEESGKEKTKLRIGVLGNNPFGSNLETACREQSGERTLSVKSCATIEDACRCDMVFISSSEQKQLPEILERLHKSRVLTVGDSPSFAEAGGMIGLVADNRKVHLEINLGNARKAGLRISPQLLQLSRVVGEQAAQDKTGL